VIFRWSAVTSVVALALIVSACATGSNAEVEGAAPDNGGSGSGAGVGSGGGGTAVDASMPSVTVGTNNGLDVDANTPPSPQEDASTGNDTPPEVDANVPPEVDAAKPKDAGIDSNSSGDDATCNGYDGPDVTSKCDACGTTHTCQANGCYGGYWCEYATKKCYEKPSGC
jgi:hypothetical protein